MAKGLEARRTKDGSQPVKTFQTFILCWFAAMLDGFDIQSISFVAPGIMKEWSIPSDQFGVVIAVGFVGAMLGTLIQGPIADRRGRRPIILWATVGAGVLGLLSAYVDNAIQLAVLRFVMGIPLGMLIPNIITLASESASPKRKFFIVAVTFSGFPLGAFIGGLISVQLLQHFDWRAVFIFGGIASLILAVFIWRSLPESAEFLRTQRGHGQDIHTDETVARADPGVIDFKAVNELDRTSSQYAAGSIRALFSPELRGGSAILWMLFASTQLALYSIVSWLPVVLTQSGQGIKNAIIPLAMFNLGGVAGGAVIGILADRFGARLILTTTFILGAFAGVFGAWALSQPATMILIASVVMGFCVAGCQLTINGVAAQWYPTQLRATGLGGAQLAGRIGGIAAPLIAGVLLSANLPSGSIFYLASFGVLLGALLIAIFTTKYVHSAQGEDD